MSPAKRRLPFIAALLLGAALVLSQCSRGSDPAPAPAAPGSTASSPAATGSTTGSSPATGAPATSAPLASTTAPTSPPTTTSSNSTTTAAGGSPSTTVPGPAPTDDPADAAKNAAYEQGYRAKCQQIWSIAPNGILSNPDDSTEQFTIND